MTKIHKLKLAGQVAGFVLLAGLVALVLQTGILGTLPQAESDILSSAGGVFLYVAGKKLAQLKIRRDESETLDDELDSL